jgi:hypothetical protein
VDEGRKRLGWLVLAGGYVASQMFFFPFRDSQRRKLRRGDGFQAVVYLMKHTIS